MNATVTDSPIDKAITKAFGQLRDISLRDGVQSWDGNKWPIEEITPVAHELNELVKMGKKRGIAMPSAEAWGGGQVMQPALYLGEDPTKNLEALHKAMPDTEIMALYRGRQGFGFDPISAEMQGKAIEMAADKGVKVFRIFDMMNDIENVKPGINAMLDYKKKHGPDSIKIEGAISYISAPDKGPRAMTLSEYGEYAVQLAKAGVDEITIKNYAGVGDKEMPALIENIRHHLDQSGHKNMKINLHDHGQKPDTVVAALAAGADKVDVAIGALSGGPSHTNMRAAINEILKAEGIDTSSPSTQTAINHNPMMKQLGRIEDAIEQVANKPRELNGKTTSFKANRAVLETITQEDADHYRVAGGAMSDVSGRIDALYAKTGKDGNPPTGFPPKDVYFKRIMEKSLKLWEQAGQFNTVTPGALILTEQATKLVTEEIIGKKSTLDSYNDTYVDIAAGRYGKNRGMEKGLGDTQWLDTMLMYRALKTMNTALTENVSAGEDGSTTKRVSDRELQLFTTTAAIGGDKSGPEGRMTLKSSGGTKQFDLKDPRLEEKLNKTDIKSFRRAVEMAGFDKGLKDTLLYELTPGRSPEPTAGIEEGHKKLAALKEKGIDVAAMHASGHRISSPEEVATLSMLLRKDAIEKMVTTVQKNGPMADSVDELDGSPKKFARQAAASKGNGAALH